MRTENPWQAAKGKNFNQSLNTTWNRARRQKPGADELQTSRTQRAFTEDCDGTPALLNASNIFDEPEARCLNFNQKGSNLKQSDTECLNVSRKELTTHEILTHCPSRSCSGIHMMSGRYQREPFDLSTAAVQSYLNTAVQALAQTRQMLQATKKAMNKHCRPRTISRTE